MTTSQRAAAGHTAADHSVAYAAGYPDGRAGVDSTGSTPPMAGSDAFSGMRIALVGPLPPPSGGMANQTAQLAALLRGAGATVELVRTNPPWRPRWLAGVRGLRALLRLPPYLWQLWRAAGRAQLLHVMANSGWSWYLQAAPAIWTGWLRGRGVLLNYRGGEAERFLARNGWLVRFSMRRADALVVPSSFLAGVFDAHRMPSRIVPNIVNLACFHPAASPPKRATFNILVARHLEPLYDNASALRAFSMVRLAAPHARLAICGEGPELARLKQLAAKLQLGDTVRFTGKLDNAHMANLYRDSDLLLNPSLADNMPISVLEAWASGVPVVSTNVGGIPHLIQHGVNGLLVDAGDASAMAQAILSLLLDPQAARRLSEAGLAQARRLSWDHTAPLLAAQYRCVLKMAPRNGYTALVSSLLFPLHEFIKRHNSMHVCRHLEQSQWLPAARLQQLQLQRLRALLQHAVAHVPYYRELFRNLNFDIQRVHDLRDLRSLPLLHKSIINARRNDFISDIAPPLQRFNTGGSSGEPLVFYLGKERVSHDVAAKWRATRWWGMDIGDREAVVWGSPIELTAQDHWRLWRDRLLRTTLLPAFDLSTARLDDYLQRLRQQRPAMLFGYPSALCLLARRARSLGLSMDKLGIRVVFVTAERLYEDQRKLLSAVFGCPVANGYGGRDAGFIAHECPEGGMHITAEDVIVEILDPQGHPVPDGDNGEIVVTHLATSDFPFIRYATGDVGALDPQSCRCGRSLPLLKQIEGRVTDFVVARDGTVMHGLALIYILRDLPEIRSFKIIQESLDRTRVLLACADGLPQTLRIAIVAKFRARLGREVDIVIEEVAAIPSEASGKHRYVISHVAPYQKG